MAQPEIVVGCWGLNICCRVIGLTKEGFGSLEVHRRHKVSKCFLHSLFRIPTRLTSYNHNRPIHRRLRTLNYSYSLISQLISYNV